MTSDGRQLNDEPSVLATLLRLVHLACRAASLPACCAPGAAKTCPRRMLAYLSSGYRTQITRKWMRAIPCSGAGPSLPAVISTYATVLKFSAGFQLAATAAFLGKRSAKINPSRSTISPGVTGISSRNIGPSHANVWNSPFSPHGSTS